MDPIIPQPGNERDPRNFVGRAATTHQARQRLQEGANLILSDPRRMGKTFWMRTFAAREPGFRSFLIDYEGVGTSQEFFSRTAQALTTSRPVQKVLKSIAEHVESASVPGIFTLKPAHRGTPPQQLLTDILQALSTDRGEDVLLVLMDEVPMAIDNIAQHEGHQTASEILQTLRWLRDHTQIRWIVAGSIGFHHVLHRIGSTAGHLNDLESLPLGPLPAEEASELAQRLLLGIGQQPTDDVVQALVEVCGGIPFLLQKVTASLRQRPVASADEARDCFETFIDDPDEFGWFEHWVTRIEPYYGEQTDAAEEVLKAALSQDHGWTPDTDLSPEASRVIDYLIKDHYLERRGTTIRWRYPVLQYIWARRKGVWDRPA